MSLKEELRKLEEEEKRRRDQYNQERKNELLALEQLGEKLCKEQMKLMHQIEHINWHISRAHPHDIATPIDHPPAFPKSCHSSTVAGHAAHHHAHHGKSQCSGKPSANMVISIKLLLFIIHASFLSREFRNVNVKRNSNILSPSGPPSNNCRTIYQDHSRIATQNLHDKTKSRGGNGTKTLRRKEFNRTTARSVEAKENDINETMCAVASDHIS